MDDLRQYEEQFRREAEALRPMGFNPYPPKEYLRIPNAKERIMAGLRYYLGDKAAWLPGYDEIAAWLSDNKGRGLLLQGTPGLGKTLICQNILPMIIHQHTRIIPASCTAYEMNKGIDALLQAHCIIVDDIGVESADTKTYGNQRYPFCELVDAVERYNKLLIVTTNLCTTHVTDPATGVTVPSIEDRYGERTLDRLRATTSVVRLQGKSLRR